MAAGPAHAIIPCSDEFRDASEALAARRNVDVGDIARSVLLLVPEAVIAALRDPGAAMSVVPTPDDENGEDLPHGLVVRMGPGHEPAMIRKALSLALALDRGEMEALLADASASGKPLPPSLAKTGNAELDDRIERLRTVVSVLAFIPLPNGVNSRSEALHVLGFPPDSKPDRNTIRAKFRMLATIHHPDSEYGSHVRMSQLNAAMSLLKRG